MFCFRATDQCGQQQKSLMSVSKVIGSPVMSKLDEIYIVDALADSAWDASIPMPEIPRDCRIFALQPSAFSVVMESNKFEAMLHRVLTQRLADLNLCEIMDFLHFVQTQDRTPASRGDAGLEWIDNSEMNKWMEPYGKRRVVEDTRGRTNNVKARTCVLM